ncbi:MAG TPA: NAD-dependent epimerase/dehydratase family protein [Solirubrobacteraceae bacterium]|jgi:nucleoside-diphosphate-sugar epimerase|nr:NAD-dependent epimerase/dehydratase family protein [Solirubrobacteraceae bacterium]
MQGICAITGASGYVGSCVAGRLANAGWEVRALCRRRSGQKQSGFTEAHFELGQTVAPQALAGADALVHLAYDFSLNRWIDIERVNVEGSRRLFAAAREAGIDRIVYVSSVAAFPTASSLYGRAKLACEQAALAADSAIVRPGRVWGPQGAASAGALERAVERLPVVPLPVPRELRLYLTHEDDLAALVEGLLDRWPAGAGKLYVATSADCLEFGEFLRLQALKTGRQPRFVQLPWRLVRLGLRILEDIGAKPPFRSDGILDLVTSDRRPLLHATDHTDRYGVSFRPYALT